MLGIDTGGAPVRRDQLDRRDAVGLEAVLASEPAHAPTERVPGDPDIGRGAVQGGQPELGQLGGDPLPLDAGPDPHTLGAGVQRDLLEVADVDEEGVGERSVGARVVSGGLRRDPQPVCAGVVDGRHDVALVTRKRYGGGPEVRCQVENLPHGVPVGIRGGHDAPGHLLGQVGEWGGGQHLRLLFVGVPMLAPPGPPIHPQTGGRANAQTPSIGGWRTSPARVYFGHMATALRAPESTFDAVEELAGSGLTATELLEEAAQLIDRVVPSDGYFLAGDGSADHALHRRGRDARPSRGHVPADVGLRVHGPGLPQVRGHRRERAPGGRPARRDRRSSRPLPALARVRLGHRLSLRGAHDLHRRRRHLGHRAVRPPWRRAALLRRGEGVARAGRPGHRRRAAAGADHARPRAGRPGSGAAAARPGRLGALGHAGGGRVAGRGGRRRPLREQRGLPDALRGPRIRRARTGGRPRQGSRARPNPPGSGPAPASGCRCTDRCWRAATSSR